MSAWHGVILTVDKDVSMGGVLCLPNYEDANSIPLKLSSHYLLSNFKNWKNCYLNTIKFPFIYIMCRYFENQSAHLFRIIHVHIYGLIELFLELGFFGHSFYYNSFYMINNENQIKSHKL